MRTKLFWSHDFAIELHWHIDIIIIKKYIENKRKYEYLEYWTHKQEMDSCKMASVWNSLTISFLFFSFFSNRIPWAHGINSKNGNRKREKVQFTEKAETKSRTWLIFVWLISHSYRSLFGESQRFSFKWKMLMWARTTYTYALCVCVCVQRICDPCEFPRLFANMVSISIFFCFSSSSLFVSFDLIHRLCSLNLWLSMKVFRYFSGLVKYEIRHF